MCEGSLCVLELEPIVAGLAPEASVKVTAGGSGQ